MVVALERTTTSGRTRQALIDCDFHNELDSIKDLYPYLSQRWREHIDAYGTPGVAGGYYPRFMDHREDARPPSGRRSGSEVAFSRQDFLDPYNVAYATTIPLTPAGRQLNPDLDAALATAVNDWQIAEWLDPEPRLRASLVVSFENPPAAVAEIERVAHDKRFVQVENGFGWIPSLIWRMDNAWTLLKSELPRLKHAPSEYVREHVYWTTQPVEEPHRQEDFLHLMEQYG